MRQSVKEYSRLDMGPTSEALSLILRASFMSDDIYIS